VAGTISIIELHYWLCGYHSRVSAYGQAGHDKA
jgi:hypothetical protein